MKFYIFASGSKGNATLLIDKGLHILIDFGISKRQLIDQLSNLNLNINDIDFVLLTHEHVDHIKSIDCITKSIVYGGKNTYHSDNYHILEPYTAFKFHNLEILPIEISHDAHTPLGFIINNDKEKLVYITDTGFISERNIFLAQNADYYIIESNHNKEMLLKTKRPAYVKERIMSSFGHLCNEDCALYLSQMIGSNTKEIFLAHVSMEANKYDLAKETCINILKKNHIDVSKIHIYTAKQFEMCEGGNED